MSRARRRAHRGLHADRGAARDRSDGRDPRRDRDRDGAMAAELEPRLRARAARRAARDRARAHRRRSFGRGVHHRRARHHAQPLFDGTELSVTFLRTALGPNTRPGLEIVRIAGDGGESGPDDGAHARALPADRARRRRGAAGPGRSGRAGARALSRDVLLCGRRSGLAQRLARPGRAAEGDPRAAARCRDRPYACGLDRDARPCRHAGRLRARRGDRRLPQSSGRAATAGAGG